MNFDNMRSRSGLFSAHFFELASSSGLDNHLKTRTSFGENWLTWVERRLLFETTADLGFGCVSRSLEAGFVGGV